MALWGEEVFLGRRENCLVHRRGLQGYGGTSDAVVGMGSFWLNMDCTNSLSSVCMAHPAYLLKFCTD